MTGEPASAEDVAAYWRDRTWLEYVLHELPMGVLYGANGANEAQCQELMRDLEHFVRLCSKLGLNDHEDYVEQCRWHFDHYPHYLGRQRHFDGYASYIRDRQGPLTVADPQAPDWLVRARSKR